MGKGKSNVNTAALDSTNKQFVTMLEEKEPTAVENLGGIKGVADMLGTNLETGLPNEAAILERRQTYGANVLPDPPTKSFIRLFFESFNDKMLIILIISAVVSLILVLCFPVPGESLGWVDSVAILVAVIIVALVQAGTNYHQQQAFTSINRLKNDNLITVVRAGERIKVNATEIVVGDVLYLDAGNKISADGLFIAGRGLKVNESSVTGETLPIDPSEKKPFMYCGSTIEAGDGYMLVLTVGVYTQTGALFKEMAKQNSAAEVTPLKEKLNKLADILTYVGLCGALLTFIVLAIMWIIEVSKRKWDWSYLSGLVQHFIVAVTIFVCAVPEGLPLAVTISLSFSMSKMMKDNNFVRHLDACETMGGASNICSDKTGTLTTNKMTVTRFYYGFHDYSQTEIPPFPKELKDYIGIGISVNTKGKVNKDENGILVYDGKSTECALCLYVEMMGYQYEELRKQHPSLYLYDFDSDRKRMTTVIKNPVNENENLVCSKGAPDIMLNYCSHYINESGDRVEITAEFKETLINQLTEYSKQMLRNMLIAYRVGGEIDTAEEAEKGLTIIGVAAISDPLRPEVPDAVAQCRKAGVIVRMVTGDNIETAKAIAKQCGILSDEGICMTGNEFRTTPKLELIEKLPKLQVLARSTPMDKFRLVRTLKEVGEVVAATGDGTNDALALRTANVGLSMGLCGTEIAKEASDICILDDNFKSIMMSILWGRCVFDNVRRFLQFQLTVNFAALVVSFLGACIWQHSPLAPIQLLWINLIMDSFGALALATEKPSSYLLDRPPYGRRVPLLSKVLIVNIAVQSIYQIVALVLILTLGSKIWPDIVEHSKQHYTMIFNTFVFCQVFNLPNSRVVAKSQKFFSGLFNNWLFWVIIVFISGFQVVIVEAIGVAFSAVPLTWIHWLSCILIGVLSLFWGFIARLIPVKELSYEAVEQEREAMYETLKEKLRGLSVEEQWALEAQEDQEEKEKANKKNQQEIDSDDGSKGCCSCRKKPAKIENDSLELSSSSASSKKKNQQPQQEVTTKAASTGEEMNAEIVDSVPGSRSEKNEIDQPLNNSPVQPLDSSGNNLNNISTISIVGQTDQPQTPEA